MKCFDAIVVGGGIVGVATAYTLLERGDVKRILILEKEAQPAMHQTGRNSGVIHAGVYYAPGSRKAILCRRGIAATKSFCDQHRIPYEERGKLIVATSETELQRMERLGERAQQNGTQVQQLSKQELTEEEPAIQGVGALLVPESAIVDYRRITLKLIDLIKERGGEICYEHEVERIEEGGSAVRVITDKGEYQGQISLCCSGLWSDRLLARSGITPDFRIVPFRGGYYRLGPRCNQLVHRMIYPVPDPEQPFLGVHITPMIAGFLTVGPNASLALSREAYDLKGIDWRDAMGQLSYPGLYRLLARHRKSALHELSLTLSKRRYVEAVNKYCPQIRVDDLQPWPAGLRAQAVARDGSMVEDFLFHNTARMVHVCNAPSPAATSAFPIAEEVADRVLELVR